MPATSVPTIRTPAACRKPLPGMLLRAAEELNLDLGRCWLVGDAWSDLQAAAAAAVRGILVRTGRGKAQEARRDQPIPPTAAAVDDLAAAVDLILGLPEGKPA